MDIFKIASIAIIGAILSLTVKQYKQELAIFIGIATGLILIFCVTDGLFEIFSELEKLIEKSGVKREYLSAIIKVVGICFVSQFCAEICRDAGQNAIAAKLEMAGKIMILLLTIPIINDFLSICINTVNLLD